MALTCERHGIPSLVIRGISDFGDRLKNDMFHLFAAKMAAVATHNFIAYGLDLGEKLSHFRQVYDESAHGHVLKHDRLSKEDFENDNAVRPHHVEEIVQTLIENKNVAVQGPPGSGKSALAAWANWIGVKKGLLFAAFLGRELQGCDVEAAVKRFEEVPSDHILIIDDIHLIKPILASIKSLPRRRFLLLGRTPFVEKALNEGGCQKFTISSSTLRPKIQRPSLKCWPSGILL